MDKENKKIILRFQRDEITEHLVYKMLSRLVRSKHNSEVMRKISEEEFRHYNIWKRYSEQEVRPHNLGYMFYTFISMVFGVTFGIKLMEKRESNAKVSYTTVTNIAPEAEEIQKEEQEHDRKKEIID